ncbi:hypothetical protein CNMCM5623_007540 [Aspergillus felis]|uniref:Endonuclease/exonuclease/phosphatase domain-containing protein n=1 Tax=Aspergillus felis TaxID=1287682 RepID=A0A8H6V1T7_9EURO|nr:hypothetical protein CNMCM5623_007540 [Aspergillus felis]
MQTRSRSTSPKQPRKLTAPDPAPEPRPAVEEPAPPPLLTWDTDFYIPVPTPPQTTGTSTPERTADSTSPPPSLLSNPARRVPGLSSRIFNTSSLSVISRTPTLPSDLTWEVPELPGPKHKRGRSRGRRPVTSSPDPLATPVSKRQKLSTKTYDTEDDSTTQASAPQGLPTPLTGPNLPTKPAQTPETPSRRDPAEPLPPRPRFVRPGPPASATSTSIFSTSSTSRASKTFRTSNVSNTSNISNTSSQTPSTASTSASSVSLPPFDPETLTPSAYRTAPFPFTSDPDPPLNSEEAEYDGHLAYKKAETGSTWGGSSACDSTGSPSPPLRTPESEPEEADTELDEAETPPEHRADRTIRILQYNVQNSLDIGMAPLLRDPRLRDYAVIAIQEPWVNTHGDSPLTHFPREAADHFHIVWPAAGPDRGPPRVCTYVRKTLRWQVTFISAHVISIATQPALVANEGVVDLIQALEAADRQQRAAEHMVVGDFNIHDGLWAGARRLPQAQHNGPRAEALKQVIEQRPLELVTPVGLITRPTPISVRAPDEMGDGAGLGTLSSEERAAGTTIDLTFVSWGLTDHVTHVREANLDGDSDHLPIETELDATFET